MLVVPRRSRHQVQQVEDAAAGAARSVVMALVMPPAAPVTTKTVSLSSAMPGWPSCAGFSTRVTV
jgi:hypothetical protein